MVKTRGGVSMSHVPSCRMTRHATAVLRDHYSNISIHFSPVSGDYNSQMHEMWIAPPVALIIRFRDPQTQC